MVSKKLGRLGHTFAGNLHVERHGVLVGVDLDAGQLGAVLVYVFPTSGFTSANRGPRSSSRKRRPHATTFESPSSTSAEVAMGPLLARAYVVRSHPIAWQAGKLTTRSRL